MNVRARTLGQLACILAGSALLAGCSTASSETSAIAATPVALPIFGHVVPGKPVDLYVKVARLGKACWFATPAPLQSGYVFTADVSPESKGGIASIVIFQHNKGQIHGANAERGPKAYEVTLSPSGEDTMIGISNERIPEAFAGRMKNDIDRWAAGETSCGSTVPWTVKAALEDGPPNGGASSRVWKASTR